VINVVALVFATIVFVLVPGPNVALIVANSLRHGLKTGLVTALGTTFGLAFQLFLVIVGMAALIELAATALEWIRWMGVAYLVYLGVRAWIEPVANLQEISPLSKSGIFSRGFGMAVVNPKTLLFNAAFLPQFVSGGEGTTGQLMMLASVYLAVIVCGDALWAVFASSARQFLGRFGHLRNRIAGGFLVGAAAGLALSRRTV
jgi:threonine/homoserine/homoserine lactone efflux protein